jgi:hypothetical protein
VTVRQDDEGARGFIIKELCRMPADPFIGLLIERDAKQIGAVILNDYVPGCNIEITMAFKGPLSIKDVRDIARYCFLRVQRVTARTSVNNARSIKMLTALGFKHEGLMRQFFKDSDAIVFGLLKSEQRIVKL